MTDDEKVQQDIDESTWFFVYRRGDQPPSKAHKTEQEAREEAERLARKHPQKEFLLLRAIPIASVAVEMKHSWVDWVGRLGEE